MTNVVTVEGYNIPKLIYDGSLTASSVTIGDVEDFNRLKEQVTRSGIFFIRPSDPTQSESIFFASVETATSIRAFRVYPTDTGINILFVLITIPPSRPNAMVYIGTSKSFTATT